LIGRVQKGEGGGTSDGGKDFGFGKVEVDVERGA
jgi:hypothetical protein